MHPACLTISIDDGHPTDLRTAELLARFGLKATFYVPGNNPRRDRLSDAEIRELAAEYDVGGHTMNHRALRGLPSEVAWSEIDDGRQWMEDVVGRRVVAFCYPKGKFDSSVKRLVQRAGYVGARTCEFNRNSVTSDPFAWGVSTHAYSHPAHVQIRHALLAGSLKGIASYARVHKLARDWEEHFSRSLDWVSKHGGVAHLYLHSWEIDENGDWAKLERVFERASVTTLERLSNAELFERYTPE